MSQTSRGKSQPIILIVILFKKKNSDELVPSPDELAVADELVEDWGANLQYSQVVMMKLISSFFAPVVWGIRIQPMVALVRVVRGD